MIAFLERVKSGSGLCDRAEKDDYYIYIKFDVLRLL